MDLNIPYTPRVRGIALVVLAAVVIAMALQSGPFTSVTEAKLVAHSPIGEHPVEIDRGWQVPVRPAAIEEGMLGDDGEVVLIVEPIIPPPSLPGVPASAALPQYALVIPVRGVDRNDLIDTFAHPRGEDRLHLAIDILAPTGTPVVAAAPGRVERLHRGGKGGIVLYLVDDSSTYIYYYAHLDGYAPGIREGMRVEKGDVIGYVGHTGNAHEDVPHLHFAIWKARPGNRALRGRPVNPYLALVRASPGAVERGVDVDE